MVDYLVFLLHAPLGAMGGIAVGERRAGFDRPGKSAILGLVAAALGLDRSEEDAHVALAGGYGLGLGEISAGRLLSDYHTTQVPPQRRGRRFATRREELAVVDDLSTILSIREYRTEPAYLVVLWARHAPRWSLGEFAQALRRPQFHLYFGRKACPLGAPLDPRIIAADDPGGAIRTYIANRTPEQMNFLRPLGLTRSPSVLALDLDAEAGAGERLRVERRRDALESRKRWQFGLRSELVQREP